MRGSPAAGRFTKLMMKSQVALIAVPRSMRFGPGVTFARSGLKTVASARPPFRREATKRRCGRLAPIVGFGSNETPT